jgi:DNA-binding MarR family transcriptional regulator
MIAPDFRRGYLRVPLVVWQRLFCRTSLTRRQLQIVAVVLRESWGWQRRGGEVSLWTRPLTAIQLAERTGLRQDHVRRSVERLVRSGVLDRRPALRGGRYRLVLELILNQPIAPDGVDNAGDNPVEKRVDKPPLLHPKLGRNRPKTGHLAPGLKIKNIDKRSSRGGGMRRFSPHDRLLALVQFFVGPLSPHERQRLRRWVKRDGATSIWQELTPLFGRDPQQARVELRRLLASQEAAILSGKEADAA